MSTLNGQQLGHYRIKSLLGTGGMGQVYRAEHIHLDRQAALKVMHANLAADPEFQSRFLREARAAAGLQHPNIIQVYDFGEDSGRYYLVMELASDGSLRTLLQRRTEQQQGEPLREQIELIRQAARGLAYAHRHDMVHRDIKPDNLLLCRTGNDYQLKVSDFGLARLADAGGLTATGTTMGTPAYMSPEQCQGLPLDGRSDLYSLGVVLYEVATGYLPFDARNLSDAVYKHVYTEPPAPREVRPDLPVELEAVILRCLAKSPDERFPDCETLDRALAEAITIAGNIASPTIHARRSILGPPEDVRETDIQTPIALATPPPVDSLADSSPAPRVRVLDRAGTTLQVIELRDEITVGRTAENDIVLPADSVSRSHIRIRRDGDRVTVTDLRSSNGTLLEGERLLPQTPQHWAPRQRVQIDPFWLRLEPITDEARVPARPQAPQEPTSGAPTVVPAAATRPVRPEPTASVRIGIVLEAPSMTLTPGHEQTLPVTIANLGETVDHFSFEVDGVPETWVRVPERSPQLNPGTRDTIHLTIMAPREPASRAGTYDFTVRARSVKDPADFGVASGQCTVLPFEASDLAVHPNRVRGRRTVQLTASIENHGNAPVRFRIRPADDEDALRFEHDAADITVGAGENVTVPITAAAPRRWIGTAQLRNLQIHAEPQGGGTPHRAAAQFVHLALIPTWVPPVAIAMLLLMGYATWNFVARPPVIETLSISPAQPIAGEPVTVNWVVTSAHQVEFEPLGVQLNPTNGSHTFVNGFADTRNLQFVARRGRRAVERSLTIPVAPPAPGTPIIEEFDVFPTAVTQGERVTIRWRVRDASTVEIEPFGTSEAEGERQHVPHQARAYTLTASNPGAAPVRRLKEVTVNQPAPGAPGITVFSVEPAEIVSGREQSVRLSWQTSNANSVSIEPGIGAVGPSGSREIPAPGSTTPFELLAVGEGGERRQQARVEVRMPDPPTIAQFSVTPSRVTAGQHQNVRLTWTTSGAENVTIEPDIGVVDASGSREIATPPTNTTFSLRATNRGGTSDEQAQFVVVAPPRPPTIGRFTVRPDSIVEGSQNTVRLAWQTAGATEIVIDPGIGRVPATGSRDVPAPPSPVTYHIRATGAGGTVTDRVSLAVTRRRPISSGEIRLRQTFSADLDRGVEGGGAQGDIRFQAQTATERYLAPTNGAQLSLIGNQPPGREGCANARYSTQRVAIASLRAGTHLCVKTTGGNYSEVRVKVQAGPSPGVLTIEHTTWR